jgi:hypothetical protein
LGRTFFELAPEYTVQIASSSLIPIGDKSKAVSVLEMESAAAAYWGLRHDSEHQWVFLIFWHFSAAWLATGPFILVLTYRLHEFFLWKFLLGISLFVTVCVQTLTLFLSTISWLVDQGILPLFVTGFWLIGIAAGLLLLIDAIRSKSIVAAMKYLTLAPIAMNSCAWLGAAAWDILIFSKGSARPSDIFVVLINAVGFFSSVLLLWKWWTFLEAAEKTAVMKRDSMTKPFKE